MIEIVEIGRKIKELRKDRNLTQQQLASRLSLTKSVISAYETEIRLPSYDTLVQIARIFNVSSDYLLGLTSVRTIDVTGLSEENIHLLRI